MLPIIIELYNNNCLTFKNINPFIFIEFKKIILYNFLVNRILEKIYTKIRFLDFTIITGISQCSIVFTSILSNKYNYTHVLLKESKNIINLEKPGKCLLFLDKIIDENIVLKYIRQLSSNNIEVVDIFVIYSTNNIKVLNDYNIHYLFNDYNIINVFNKHNIISDTTFRKILKSKYIQYPNEINDLDFSYEYRYNNIKTNILKKLFYIMLKKKTNICIDITNKNIKEIIECIGRISKHICLIKIPSNLITNMVIVKSLNKISEELDIIILLDGNYNNEYKLNNSINVINYPINFNLSDKTNNIILDYNIGIKENIIKTHIDELYSIELIKLKKDNENIVGFISDNRLINNNSLIYLSKLLNISSDYNTNYNNINNSIINNNCDIVILDNSINNLHDTINICKIIGWTSYMEKNNT